LSVSPLSSFRNRLIIIVFWLACIATQYFILIYFDVPLEIAFTDSGVSNIFLAAAAILFVNTLRFYRPSRTQYVLLVAWCAALTALSVFAAQHVLNSLFGDVEAYESFLAHSTPIRAVVNFLVIAESAISGLLWYNQEDQKKSEARKTEAEKLSRDAELYKLRQQLQPHFLFNSLNSISALAGSRPEQARKMIQQLSDFLRGALKKEDHQWIALDEEIQHLRLYLEMEQMRFGHRLTTNISMDEESGSVQVPPMLLQPIVENAIKFGLYDTTEQITILIKVSKSSDFLQIEVVNPYDPETASPQSGTGFGLSSVKRRLYLLFARNDLVSTVADNKHFTTTVKIPLNDYHRIN
jgi:two-component system LytT family sensor kinase